jgi:hypothetical protein
MMEQASVVLDEWVAELRRLEEPVQKSEHDGVRARWESGRYMLTLRKRRKQLPHGLLNELAEKIGVVRSELGARMKFAEKYPTEEKVSTAIESVHSWSDIKQRGLTDKPHDSSRSAESWRLYARPSHANRTLRPARDR